MKAKLLQPETSIYLTPQTNSGVLTILNQGQVIDLGSQSKKSGVTWVSAKLSDGHRGYIPGETRVQFIKNSTLLDNEVSVHYSPTTHSAIMGQFKKGQRFDLVTTVEGEGGQWVEVSDDRGVHGYILGSTKVRTEQSAISNPGRDVVVGGLWFVGGIAVTAISLQLSSGGGTGIIAWGAILFGFIQFCKGIWGMINAQ